MTEPIITVRHTMTEEDCRRATDYVIDQMFARVNGLKISSLLFFVLPMGALIVLLALSGAAKHWVPITVLAALIVVVLVWRAVFRAILKKANGKTVRVKREAGELNLPTEAVFYPDRLVIINATTRTAFPWQEITDVSEAADGLHLAHLKNRYLYFPARFFDPDTASAVTGFLQQTLGARYRRHAVMQVPQTAETVGEVGQPEREEGTPQYAFDFELTGADAAVVTGRAASRILLIFALLLAALVALLVWRGVSMQNFRPAIVTAIIGTVILATLRSSLAKARKNQPVTTKPVSTRWYEDHVTVVTYQDEGYSQIHYAKLRKLRRQGRLTVAFFRDNTFLYVPQSAFTDDAERTEFEQFLKKIILKYSKQ